MTSHQKTRNRKLSALMRTSALTAVGLVAVTFTAQAEDYTLPVNGQVVGGSSTITNPATGVLHINQHTDRTVINWDSFNIGTDGTVQFFQPGTGSLAVNRVVGLGKDPTKILGTLRANGNVMVLDRNGVLFGKEAVIDVGGLVASTGDVGTQAIMDGGNFALLSNLAGSGSVVNEGTITVADSGLAAFVAPVVENNGTINARLGRVALAAGGDTATVDLYGDGLVELTVGDGVAKVLSANSGTINAEGGHVEMTALAAKSVIDQTINMSGVINATHATVKDGKIVLSASSGKVTHSGKMNAGKTVDVKADTIAIEKGSVIEAGSDEQAGTVNIISSNRLNYNGYINAHAGFAETSAATTLTVGADAVVRSGSWLLDPLSITVDDTAGEGIVFDGAIEDALNNHVNVSLFTNPTGPNNGNIFVKTLIEWVTDADLSLDAIGDIHFEGTGGLVSSDAANITVRAGDDVRFPNAAHGSGIQTMGGDITITSGDITRIRSGNVVNANGGNILIDNGGALIADAGTIRTTGNGTITVNQNKTSDVIVPGLEYLATIQGALDAIQNDGAGLNTINVGAGDWLESVTVNKDNILLKGVMESVQGRDHFADSSADHSFVFVSDPSLSVLTVTGANNVTVDGFDFRGGKGVRIESSSDVVFRNNTVSESSGNGIEVAYSPNTRISHNSVYRTDDDGINVYASSYATIDNNTIGVDVGDFDYYGRYYGFYDYMEGYSYIGGNGIHTMYSGNGLIEDNTIMNVGDNGILVTNAYPSYDEKIMKLGAGVSAILGEGVSILGNTIDYTDEDGIAVYYSRDVLIDGNVIGENGYYPNIWGDGIGLWGVSGAEVTNNRIFRTYWNGIGIYDNAGYTLVKGNEIRNVNEDGIYISGYYGGYYGDYYGYQTRMVVDNYDGYYEGYYGSSEIFIEDNIIENDEDYGIGGKIPMVASAVYDGYYGGYYGYSGYAGIEVDAGMGSYVSIAGNTIGGSFEYGILGRSGDIDLTGAGNTIHDTYIGMGFYPSYRYDSFDRGVSLMMFDYFDYMASLLHLVDDTIGATDFVDQAYQFVDLGYGAFFAPGFPTLLDGMKATYTTGGAKINPPASGGRVTQGEADYLESMFTHYVDYQDRGLFLFPVVETGGVDQKDVFRTFDTILPVRTGGTLVITGLPRIGGPNPPAGGGGNGGAGGFDFAANNLNEIAPAAGDEDDNNSSSAPDQVEPAAGGGVDNVPCWAAANQSLNQGTPVQMNYGNTAAQSLENAVSCTDQSI